MGGIAQAVGGLFGAGGQGGTYTAGMLPGQTQQIQNTQQNIAQLYGQQQGLAGALQNQMNGIGPNPAQAMLNQATQQNQQMAAGTVASQKGINPALAARLAGEQSAQINQQAAGQGALMNAQQQLAAQQQLGGLYGQMGQQQLGYNNTLTGAVNAQNNVNGSMAQSNMAQQSNLMGGALGGIGSTVTSLFAHGGQVPSHLRGFVDHLAAHGGGVPGQALVSGDSPKNDTVPAMLSPKEIVLPRSVTMSANPGEAAKAFVEKIKGSGGDEEAQFREALKREAGKRKKAS